MRKWILAAALLLVAASPILIPRWRFDSAFEDAKGRFHMAYAHRDDEDDYNWKDFEAAENRLASITPPDSKRLQEWADIHSCGVALRDYRTMHGVGYDSLAFDRAAAACVK